MNGGREKVGDHENLEESRWGLRTTKDYVD